MSDVADEELLNGDEEEFDYAGYDLSYEKEEALLEDDYSSGEEKSKHLDKKEEESSDVEDDVLNLDIEGEEDFQDVEEEKPSEKVETKSVQERAPAPAKVSTSTAKPPLKPQVTKNPAYLAKNKDQEPQKVPAKIENNRRRGTGRGTFQSRPNFARNNLQKDRRPQTRRNGTVFINPKYEGTVNVTDNNTRLAWDNATYNEPNQSNSNFIQPWRNTQERLITNLVATISSNPNLLQLTPQPRPQPVLNFEPPPPDVHHNQVDFQSPVVGSRQNYCTFTQVQPQQSFQPYPPVGPPQYNNQVLQNNNMQPSIYNTNYDSYYNTPHNQQQNYYQNNMLKNEPRQNQQNDFNLRNKNIYRNSNYGNQSDYQITYTGKDNNYQQNRNSFMNNQNTNNRFGLCENRQDSYNRNATSNMYENRNVLQKNNYQLDNSHNIRNFNRNIENRPLRQIPTIPMNSNNSDNKNYHNRNFQGQKFRRYGSKDNIIDVKTEVPEKKIKMEEPAEQKSETVKKTTEQTTTNKITFEEEEDEETRRYRLKIEEQKREREKVLKMKEERRRMRLLQEKQQEEQQKQQQIKQEPTSTTNQQQPTSTTNQQQPVKQEIRTNDTLPKQQQFVRTNQQRLNKPIDTTFSTNQSRPKQIVNRPTVVGDDLSNLTFKITNKNNAPPTQKANNQSEKKEASSSGFMTDRVVVVKNKSLVDGVKKGGASLSSSTNQNLACNSSVLDKKEGTADVGLSSFFNNRKVLKKDGSLLNTRLVVVNNLSASTNENKLASMARGIGEIQTLRLDKQERQATILFKSVATAHAFFKKYQRYMLDLSMIEVKLEPMI